MLVHACLYAFLYAIYAFLNVTEALNIYIFVSVGLAACSAIEVSVVLSRRREPGRYRGKRESLRRVRALMAPLTTSSVMVSLSL